MQLVCILRLLINFIDQLTVSLSTCSRSRIVTASSRFWKFKPGPTVAAIMSEPTTVCLGKLDLPLSPATGKRLGMS